MSIQILMQALGILHVASKGVESVEAAVAGIVVTGSEVLQAGCGVGLFAAEEDGGASVVVVESFAVWGFVNSRRV